MNLSGLLDFIKLKPKYYFIFSIASGCVLFMPPDLKNQLNINLEGVHNSIVGLCFIISSMLWVYSFFEYFFSITKKWGKKHNGKRELESILKKLSGNEIDVLSYFYAYENNIMKFSGEDLVVNGLCQYGILEVVCFPGTNSFTLDAGGMPFKISQKFRMLIDFEINDKKYVDGDIRFNYKYKVRGCIIREYNYAENI